jgi:mevalonate kinase
MKSATGRAPGKTILIGEHAVVYGHPAIGIPVYGVGVEVVSEMTRDEGVAITSLESPNGLSEPEVRAKATMALRRLVEQALATFGEEAQGVSVRVKSDVPIGCGMGSSASLCVAAIRSICGLLDRQLAAPQISDMAYEAETFYHATPSGIDNSVVAHERPIYFVKRKGPHPIQVGDTSFKFLIADSGVSRSTADIVAEVRQYRDEDRAKYDSMFWEIGSMASVAREVIRGGNRAELGMCMNRNHEILCDLGLTCGEVEHIVEAAREAGAAGAKVSGAGRGGCVLALLGDDTDEGALAAAIKQAGAREIYETELA